MSAPRATSSPISQVINWPRNLLHSQPDTQESQASTLASRESDPRLAANSGRSLAALLLQERMDCRSDRPPFGTETARHRVQAQAMGRSTPGHRLLPHRSQPRMLPQLRQSPAVQRRRTPSPVHLTQLANRHPGLRRIRPAARR